MGVDLFVWLNNLPAEYRQMLLPLGGNAPILAPQLGGPFQGGLGNFPAQQFAGYGLAHPGQEQGAFVANQIDAAAVGVAGHGGGEADFKRRVADGVFQGISAKFGGRDNTAHTVERTRA